MDLIINGQPKSLDEVVTLEDVVNRLGLQGKPIVAEVDGVVLTAAQWKSQRLMDGMRIELVHFVGGG